MPRSARTRNATNKSSAQHSVAPPSVEKTHPEANLPSQSQDAQKASARQLGKEDLRTVYELQAELCKSLAHPVRLEIIDILRSGELANTVLIEKLGLPKANVSAHIAVLKEAKILNTRKEGVQIYVALRFMEVVEACQIVRTALGAIVESRHSENQLARNLLLNKV